MKTNSLFIVYGTLYFIESIVYRDVNIQDFGFIM